MQMFLFVTHIHMNVGFFSKAKGHAENEVSSRVGIHRCHYEFCDSYQETRFSN